MEIGFLNTLLFVENNIVKLHSNLQTGLNFSWLEKELTLFSPATFAHLPGNPNPHLNYSL